MQELWVKSSIQCQKEGTQDEGTEALRAWSQMSRLAQDHPSPPPHTHTHWVRLVLLAPLHTSLWSERPGLRPEEAVSAGTPPRGHALAL